MRLSQNFTKTRRDAPKDETAKNAQLLIRAGYIYKDAAGVYGMLPLGLKVVNRIIQIIREEMNSLGSQELTMTTLQRRELWEQTDRWDDDKVDVWFKSKLKNVTSKFLQYRRCTHSISAFCACCPAAALGWLIKKTKIHCFPLRDCT